MRRIIERVVTVVTTTTWKISWEPDTAPFEASVDTVGQEIPSPRVISETSMSAQQDFTASNTKEVDPTDIGSMTETPDSYPYPINHERKPKS